MKTIKLFITLVAMIATTTTFAQIVVKENIHGEQSQISTNSSSHPSFYGAVVASFDLPGFSEADERIKGVTAGALFNHSISKTSPIYYSWSLLVSYCFDGESDYDYKYRYSSFGIQPLGFSYRLSISDNVYFTPSAGIGFRIGYIGSSGVGESFQRDDLFDDLGYKRFTMGYNVGANLEFNKVLFGVNYGGDFTEIVDESDSKYNNISNRVGFKF